MKRNNGSSSDGNDRDFEAGDGDMRAELGDRLRREAMAERPVFSEQLHHRAMQQIRREARAVAERDSRFRLSFWLWPATAAAAALLAYGLIAPWPARSPLPMQPGRNETIVENTPQAAALSLNIGDVVYERAWPPGITLCLPAVIAPAAPAADGDASATDEASAQPTDPVSSDWLLSALDEPTRNATAALADLVPPEVQMLISLARSQQ